MGKHRLTNIFPLAERPNLLGGQLLHGRQAGLVKPAHRLFVNDAGGKHIGSSLVSIAAMAPVLQVLTLLIVCRLMDNLLLRSCIRRLDNLLIGKDQGYPRKVLFDLALELPQAAV